MGNVIGLFPCKQNILYQMEQLDEAGIDKRNILRNCVEPELGKHIFDCAFRKVQETII